MSRNYRYWMASCIKFAFVILIAIVGCNDDDQTERKRLIGAEYFPLSLGQETTFLVDSIIYDDFNNSVDTLSFQRRERVVDQFLDNQGRNVFVTELSFRSHDSAAWRVQKNYTQLRLTSRAEVMEDNQTRIPLIFPINANETWNSNILNALPELNFRYKNLFEPFEVNNLLYDSTVTIAQIDEENLIERFFAEEKYASGIGMIYRKDISLNTKLDGEIINGYEATFRLLDFQP